MSETHDIVARPDVSAPAGSIMHPAVEKMLSLNPTPETLKQILDLQREWERGEAKKAYTRAIVDLKRDLPASIKRDQVVDYAGAKGRVHYTHASLAAALEAVQPALTAHGFSLSWTPAVSGDKVSVTATLSHRNGHSESATLSAAPDASGNKSGPQAVASTVTLLQRYTALSILGIATADMKEPNGDEGAAPAATGAVDSAKNMRAMGDISKAGKSRQEAEGHAGRPIQQWTSDDLARLKKWITPAPAQQKPSQMDAPPDDWQPGENDPVEPGSDVVEEADAGNPLAPAEKPSGPYIGKAERQKLYSAWTKAGKPDAFVRESLALNYGIGKTEEVPIRLYDEILAWCADMNTNPSKASRNV